MKWVLFLLLFPSVAIAEVPHSGVGTCPGGQVVYGLVQNGPPRCTTGGGGGGSLPPFGAAGASLFQDPTGSFAVWATCGGDVTCSTLTSGSYTVTRIQGNAVVVGTPTNNQVYIWNTGSNRFQLTTLGALATKSTSGTSILKGDNLGGITNAVSGTDYAPKTPPGTSILKANNGGGFNVAVAGVDFPAFPTGAANTPLLNNGASGFANGTTSGNTTKIVTTAGTLNSGDCAAWDASGNVIDAGAACASNGLPPLGSPGTPLFQNAAGNAAAWTACAGDVTCSAITPGSYTVTKIQGNTVKSGTPNDAQILVWNNTNHDWESVSLSGGVTIANTGLASLNANNITSGVVPTGSGGAGSVNGILKANGSGNVSAASTATDYAPAVTGGANTPLFNNGSNGFTNGTVSGNTTKVATSNGSTTSGDCANWDLNGNIVDSGGPCGSSSGGNPPGGVNGNIQIKSGTGTFGAYGGTAARPANKFIAGLDANGAATFTQPIDADVLFSDITTGNASTSAHGYTPKGDANTTHFLNGALGWTTPSGVPAGVSGNLQINNGAGALGAFLGSGPLGAHLFANQINASGALSGVQPDISDLTGLPVPEASGGTGTNYGEPNTKIQIANNTGTGTTLNKLVVYNTTASPATATVAPAGTTSGIIGLCTAGCGASGTATVLTSGATSCVFDNATTVGHYIGVSASVAGDCTDLGSTSQPTGTLVVGRVTTTNASAGTYMIVTNNVSDTIGSGGSGVPSGSAGQVVGYNAIGGAESETVSGPVTFSRSATNAYTSVLSTTGVTGTGCTNCTLSYDATGRLTSAGSGAGGNAAVNAAANSGAVPYYSQASPPIIDDLANIFYAIPSSSGDPLGTAFAKCPNQGWTAGQTINVGTTQITDNKGDIEIGKTSGTAGGSTPAWSTSPCTFGAITTDGTGSWFCVGPGAIASSPCTVIAPPGTFNIAHPLLIGQGGSSSDERLLLEAGASVKVNATGSGEAGIIIGNRGKLEGAGTQNSSVTLQSGKTVDAVVESWQGFTHSAMGLSTTTAANMDVENIELGAGSGTINQAVLWVAGTEGQGTFKNMIVGIPGANETAIRVDDTNQQWNALIFDNIWVESLGHGTPFGQDGIGYDIECGHPGNGSLVGGQSLQIIGGAVVDFSGTVPTWIKINGVSNHKCNGISVIGTYIETSNQTAGDGTGISINFANDVNITGVFLNGGPKLANGITIANSNQIHVQGACGGQCNQTSSSLISNTDTGYTNGSNGAFDYYYTSSSAAVPPTFDGQGYQVAKTSAPGSAPGAGACQIYAVAGTGTTCNIDAICGTSTTPVVIGTSVGSGC